MKLNIPRDEKDKKEAQEKIYEHPNWTTVTRESYLMPSNPKGCCLKCTFGCQNVECSCSTDSINKIEDLSISLGDKLDFKERMG